MLTALSTMIYTIADSQLANGFTLWPLRYGGFQREVDLVQGIEGQIEGGGRASRVGYVGSDSRKTF